ncbi:MAG: hypothetical protein KDD82_00860, partial [Planctomycetes bacterium]|nr:hypothetical protein [Planctomycetota bacterium]
MAQAAAEVFAEAPPASDGEAEVYGRAWGRILAGFAPRERVTGLQAYGELVGWCGPRGRYGALYNRARGELRVLDRERVCLLAGGLPLRGVTQVAVAARPRDPGLAELYVDYALGVRARGRWRLEPDELPEAVSHVPFAARWTRLATPADELPPGLFGEASLYVEAVEWPIPSDAAWRGASCAAWLHAGTLTVVDGEARSYDLAASWARRDPVAAASDSLGSSRCAFLPDGALLAGLARV